MITLKRCEIGVVKRIERLKAVDDAQSIQSPAKTTANLFGDNGLRSRRVKEAELFIPKDI